MMQKSPPFQPMQPRGLPFSAKSYPDYLRKFADKCEESKGPEHSWGHTKIGDYIPLSWNQWNIKKREEYLDNRKMRDIWLEECGYPEMPRSGEQEPIPTPASSWQRLKLKIKRLTSGS